MFKSLSGGSVYKDSRSSSVDVPVERKQSLFKTELCRYYERDGVCKFSDGCHFAHGRDELRTVKRHTKYKTEQCRLFHQEGVCPFGARCWFIHDPSEAQQLEQEFHSPVPTAKRIPRESTRAASASLSLSPLGKRSPLATHHHNTYSELLSSGKTPTITSFEDQEVRIRFSSPPPISRPSLGQFTRPMDLGDVVSPFSVHSVSPLEREPSPTAFRSLTPRYSGAHSMF